MNVFCGFAARATILAIASAPLLGAFDRARVDSERQTMAIGEEGPEPLQVAMELRKAAKELRKSTTPAPTLLGFSG